MNYFIALLLLVSLSAPVLGQQAGERAPIEPSMTFIPDWTFKGPGLDEWRMLGAASWRADGGELTGTAKQGTAGGWLMTNQSYQDVGFRALFKCTDGAETGILFRMEKAGEGIKGILLSISEEEVAPFRVTLDAAGKELSRVPLRRAGGIWYRLAPPPDEDERQAGSYRRPKEPEVFRPVTRPDTRLRPGEWNQVEIFFDLNVIRTFLNDGREIGAATDEELESYGPIALFAGGAGEVHFKDIGIKDLAVRHTPAETSSPRFRVQRISDMYYSWGADAADFDKDGIMDVVSGPNIFFGPDYTRHREIFPAISVSPSTDFTDVNAQFTYDFNGDGWPDVLTSPSRAVLYMNPGEASRRWDKYVVLETVQTEITDFKDIDGDGRPELIYGANGSLRYAKPDPDDPAQPWTEYVISEEGYSLAHGIGTGDINGDGRPDILNAYGWWEQPSSLTEGQLWKYQPQAFGRYGHRSSGIGGSLMAVYDVNGDQLNDVVTSLNAHGFGLAWFEQQRDQAGTISFVRHMISDDYSEESAGGVTFSQAHGTAFADIDGDGIQDFIVGKRCFTHLDNYYDPDPYSPPVLYWYRTVRDPEAPGGARLVPELIHNRSGSGSEITVTDLDKDGKADIITATNRGTFIFWNRSE